MGRAIGITNQETSTIFWMIGLILTLVVIKYNMDFHSEIQFTNPGLAAKFSMIIFMLSIAIVFYLMSMFLPNYMISKYNLDLFVNRISNPDYIGWLRFTKAKGFRSHIVKKGPLGQTMGVANGVKADCINNGDYTVTLPNGNQAIIKHDMLSHNIDLEQNQRWELIKKHFGIIGFDAWEKCASDEETMFEVEDVFEDEELPEEDSKDGK